MKELVFALPADNDRVSGGNLYNAALIEALRPLASLRVLSLADCRAEVARGAPAVFFIDSLDLEGVLGFPPAQPGQVLVLIAHHLPSLEPDLAAGAPALEIERAALPRFDGFLTTSPFTADWLVGRGQARDRILTVVPAAPPVSDPPWDAAADQSAVRGLMVGNLIPRKSVRELLRSLAGELRPGDRLSLEIVGRADLDPDYAAACARLAREQPALRGRVILGGTVPHPRMHEPYRRANLMISASRMETFGMALQEARAHGLPVLALDAGHARHHFTDGHDGVLCDSLPALVGQLLALAREPARLRALLERARAPRAASGYTWGVAGVRLLAELERLLLIADQS
ncbi:MAG TPA: glycosyltransferase family 4 protein [Polyangia bacterium]|nr:glycosyltransferase family 4 protein [Polyangia bacterium]